MEFVPQEAEAKSVPYFDDVKSDDGWQGHATSKSVKKLKQEVTEAIARLGGMVTGFKEGAYVTSKGKRQGFQVWYVIENDNGMMSRGKIDVAALPVKHSYRARSSMEKRQERSLKMALYMLRTALNGTWFLQQLSPGYAPLMPWLLDEKSGKTVTQLWSEQSSFLLPEGSGEFIDGDYEEVKD